MPGDTSTKHKKALRQKTHRARADLTDAGHCSRQALAHLRSFSPYASSRSVLHYVSARSELPTHDLVQAELTLGRQAVYVPWCRGEELELFRLQDWNELTPGAYGILEPRPELRERQERHGNICSIELVIAPGVAFDRRGGRLGHGKGYYDRLLARATSDTKLVGLCFECQVVEAVPCDPHDVPMHWLVTEAGITTCGSAPLT